MPLPYILFYCIQFLSIIWFSKITIALQTFTQKQFNSIYTYTLKECWMFECFIVIWKSLTLTEERILFTKIALHCLNYNNWIILIGPSNGIEITLRYIVCSVETNISVIFGWTSCYGDLKNFFCSSYFIMCMLWNVQCVICSYLFFVCTTDRSASNGNTFVWLIPSIYLLISK